MNALAWKVSYRDGTSSLNITLHVQRESGDNTPLDTSELQIVGMAVSEACRAQMAADKGQTWVTSPFVTRRIESGETPAEPPQCTGPFSDAFDCPVHDPRKQAAPPAVAPVARLVAKGLVAPHFEVVRDIDPVGNENGYARLVSDYLETDEAEALRNALAPPPSRDREDT